MPRPRDWIDRTLQLMGIMESYERKHPVPKSPWPDGSPPTSHHAFIVADGFLSRSTEQGNPLPFIPLLSTLRPIIAEAAAPNMIRGISYCEPGVHYGRRNTVVSPLHSSAKYVFPYTPQTSCQWHYIGFSLGGFLLLTGLAEWLRQMAQTQSQELMVSLPTEVILLQPAFALAPNVAQRVRQGNAYVPQTLVRFAESRQRVLERVMESVQTLRHADVPVTIIYWPGDAFMEYPEPLLQQLSATGVAILRRELVFPDETADPFKRHSMVPQQEAFLETLRTCLESKS